LRFSSPHGRLMPRTFEQLTPQNFSFNSPLGWCEACEGLGVELGTNQQVLGSNPNLSLLDGAVSAWPDPRSNATFRAFLEALAGAHDIPLEIPWYQLDSRSQRVILYGSDRPVTLNGRAAGVSPLTESSDEESHGANAP